MVDRARARDGEHDGRAPQKPGELDVVLADYETPGDGPHAGRVATEREIRHERDPLALAEVDDAVVAALGDVVAVLHGGDRHDPAGSLDLLDGHLGDPHMTDRATVDV